MFYVKDSGKLAEKYYKEGFRLVELVGSYYKKRFLKSVSSLDVNVQNIFTETNII